MVSGHGSCALDWEEAHFFSGKAVSEAATEVPATAAYACAACAGVYPSLMR
jgi:hypothetical protein